MSKQRGEIYFVREIERTGEQSPFVKMGLVRYSEGRDSFSRLLEHQTGNPRRLELDANEVVQTEAVDLVESQLHKRFAPQRVSGEWFEFDSDSQVQEALSLARSLSEEIAPLATVIREAEALKSIASNEQKIPASQLHLEMAAKLLQAKAELKVIKVLEGRIQKFLTSAKDEGASLEGVAETKTRTYSEKFQAAEFEAAYPDLYKQYIVAGAPKITGSFLLKYKTEDSEALSPEFDAEIAFVTSAIDAVTRHDQVALLNEPNLKLRQLRGVAEWNELISESRLKVEVGINDAIDGICTWIRREKVTFSLDEERLAQEHPDMIRKFMKPAQTKTYVAANKTKI